MHLGNAVAAHEEWKAKFKSALSNGAAFDAAIVSADNCCELGNWLRGEGNALFGRLPTYTHCVATHRMFHQEAGKIAQAINEKNLAGAVSLMEPDAPFSKASNALAAAILQLKTDAISSPGAISLIAKLSG